MSYVAIIISLVLLFIIFKKVFSMISIFRFQKFHSPDLLYKFQVHPKMKLIFISNSSTDIVGYTPEENYQDPLRPVRKIFSEHKPIIEKLVNREVIEPITYEARYYKRTNDDSFWLEQHMVPYFDFRKRLRGYYGVARDITDKKKLEEELKRISLIDELTQVYNRNYLTQVCQMPSVLQYEENTVVVCDLDNMKKFNDIFGHAYGDGVLKTFAQYIKDVFPRYCKVYRYGGDEFVVLLEGFVKKRDLLSYINQLKNKTKKVESGDVQLSVSIGYARFNSKDNFEKAISIADERMYKEKKERQIKESVYRNT